MNRLIHLASLSIALSASSFAAEPAQRYFNAKYELSFALPAHADVCRSPAPLPNHGLLFRPAGVTSPPCDDDIEDGDRYTSADAHFDVDGTVTANNFVKQECSQFAFDLQGRVTRKTPSIRPGRLAWAGCRIDGKRHIEEVLFARRSRPAPPVDYTLVMRTTPQDYSRDHAAFERWLSTVRIGPSKP